MLAVSSPVQAYSQATASTLLSTHRFAPVCQNRLRRPTSRHPLSFVFPQRRSSARSGTGAQRFLGDSHNQTPQPASSGRSGSNQASTPTPLEELHHHLWLL